MIQPPITEQELPRLHSDLADLMHQAHNYYETVRMTPFADLASKHITWLALYQVGEEISHLAERLDSIYQAQFSGQADPDDDPPSDPSEMYDWEGPQRADGWPYHKKPDSDPGDM